VGFRRNIEIEGTSTKKEHAGRPAMEQQVLKKPSHGVGGKKDPGEPVYDESSPRGETNDSGKAEREEGRPKKNQGRGKTGDDTNEVREL